MAYGIFNGFYGFALLAGSTAMGALYGSPTSALVVIVVAVEILAPARESSCRNHPKPTPNTSGRPADAPRSPGLCRDYAGTEIPQILVFLGMR